MAQVPAALSVQQWQNLIQQSLSIDNAMIKLAGQQLQKAMKSPACMAPLFELLFTCPDPGVIFKSPLRAFHCFLC